MLDAGFLLAFRTGKLTEQQADEFARRDPLELRFLLMPLSLVIAAGTAPVGTCTPSGSIPPFANAFWETIGQIIGAMTSRWAAREVGAWVILTPRVNGGLTVIVNMGPRAYVPGLGLWLTRTMRRIFGNGDNDAKLLPSFLTPRLMIPRPGQQMVAHLGHSHPVTASLIESKADKAMFKRLFDEYGKSTGAARQDPWIVLVGPTGQWRLADLKYVIKYQLP